jgi:hypothetical protein
MEYYRNVKVERDESVDQGRRDRDLEDFPEIVGGLEMPTTTVHTPISVPADGDDAEGVEE